MELVYDNRTLTVKLAGNWERLQWTAAVHIDIQINTLLHVLHILQRLAG